MNGYRYVLLKVLVLPGEPGTSSDVTTLPRSDPDPVPSFQREGGGVYLWVDPSFCGVSVGARFRSQTSLHPLCLLSGRQDPHEVPQSAVPGGSSPQYGPVGLLRESRRYVFLAVFPFSLPFGVPSRTSVGPTRRPRTSGTPGYPSSETWGPAATVCRPVRPDVVPKDVRSCKNNRVGDTGAVSVVVHLSPFAESSTSAEKKSGKSFTGALKRKGSHFRGRGMRPKPEPSAPEA